MQRSSLTLPRHGWQHRFCSVAARCVTIAVLQAHDTDTPTRPVHAVGDPTEGALVIAAHRLDHSADLEVSLPRVAELLFDSTGKRRLHQLGAQA